ncbi:MAG: hypothetical protein KDA91_20880 [Planctomycetaceae bacterium]|nr:hypothetical protein [Planctomycetaceae bacterium]
MRRVLFAAAALTLALTVSGSASAQERCPQCGQVHQRNVVVRQSVSNPFEKLMQIERRKNAWLARTFLGR